MCRTGSLHCAAEVDLDQVEQSVGAPHGSYCCSFISLKIQLEQRSTISSCQERFCVICFSQHTIMQIKQLKKVKWKLCLLFHECFLCQTESPMNEPKAMSYSSDVLYEKKSKLSLCEIRASCFYPVMCKTSCDFRFWEINLPELGTRKAHGKKGAG